MNKIETLDTRDAINLLKSNSENGLSEKEALERLSKHGYNILPDKKHKSFLRKFLSQLSDFMVVILMIAATVSFVVSLINCDPDFTDPIIIMVIVIINAVLGVIQENKAEKAIETLKELTPQRTAVIRDGKTRIVNASTLVPGDIILLESGAGVPADCRILSSVSLTADESSLTGESVSSEKSADSAPADGSGFSPACLYSGTTVTSGSCRAVVFATGTNSSIGKIADLINNAEEGDTPLQKKLRNMGKMLGISAIIICIIIFIMGIFGGGSIFEMFMLSVSLAVAAIPEGLPSVVTIVLAIGVRRMVRSNVVVKKLQSVEALGSATVICSDKTGTLTKNEMTLKSVIGLGGEIEKSDHEYARLLALSVLCNSAEKDSSGRYIGNETDAAFLKAADEARLSRAAILRPYRRVSEIPFDSEKKYSAVTLHSSEGSIQIFKGAPDIILKNSLYVNDRGNIRRMTNSDRKRIDSWIKEYAAKGLRMISTATRKDRMTSTPSALVFECLYGFIDPPREEALQAVATCKKAGIKPVMITGDHVLTAKAIAKTLGIYKDSDRILSGNELSEMSDRELQSAIRNTTVFARVSPEHKVRIVNAFKASGNIVAMTGDGVNDAPALKAADIGCAMGKKGTDVAKNAADIVLLDDNFASIVKAVREGRGIFDNIRKAVHFLLSSNIGEIFTIFASFVLHLPTPLLPIQLLWINLITDSLPALAIGAEKFEKGVMTRKPRNPKENLITGRLGIRLFAEGILIGTLAVSAFVLTLNKTLCLPTSRTVCFLVLCLSQLIHSFNVKNSGSIFRSNIFSNKYHIISFLICTSLAIIIVNTPVVASVFSLTPLSTPLMLFTAGISFVPVIFDEIIKKFAGR